MPNSKYHQEVEAIRFETTVGQEGIVYLPNVAPGERVEVIVLKLPTTDKPRRMGEWIKGEIKIREDFNDPNPGMEDHQ